MATPNAQTALSGLALRLVRNGVLDETAAEEIQAKASKKNRSFFTQLKSSKKIDSVCLARTASEEFGVPLVDIASFDMENAPITLVQDRPDLHLGEAQPQAHVRAAPEGHELVGVALVLGPLAREAVGVEVLRVALPLWHAVRVEREDRDQRPRRDAAPRTLERA